MVWDLFFFLFPRWAVTWVLSLDQQKDDSLESWVLAWLDHKMHRLMTGHGFSSHTPPSVSGD